MSVADKLKALPPFPDRPEDVQARLVALEARNELLAEALGNFCEAWQLLRGEYPPEVADVLRACKAA